MTLHTLAVLQILYQQRRRKRGTYGLEIIKATGMRSGSVYPILARLESRGWVTSEWEQLDPVAAGRPARRWYKLTPGGLPLARMAARLDFIDFSRSWQYGERNQDPGQAGRPPAAS